MSDDDIEDLRRAALRTESAADHCYVMAARTNRHRLEQIAHALRISPDVLLASACGSSAPPLTGGTEAVSDLQSIREIIECFAKIEDSEGRARLLAFARELAGPR